MPQEIPVTVEVVKATPADIEFILGWLEQEHKEDGYGFWCNRNSIARPSRPDCLWIVRSDSEAIGFQLGRYSADIVSVRKDYRNRGIGRALVRASIERAHRDDVNVLSVHCTPEESLGFWARMGFVRYDDPDFPDQIKARLILQRDFDLPPNLPSVNVVIGFYPESATYAHAAGVRPIVEHRVIGVRDDDDSIMLNRRVIGLRDDDLEGDLVIKIETDGVVRCFCKAKREKAANFGVERDYVGGTFFIDSVGPGWDHD